MKYSVVLLCSDRPGIAIHSSLAAAVFPEWYTGEEKKRKGIFFFFFLLLQHLPNFPTKWSVDNVQEIPMNAHHLVKEWQQTPQLSLASIHLLPWCLFKASSAYLFSS